MSISISLPLVNLLRLLKCSDCTNDRIEDWRVWSVTGSMWKVIQGGLEAYRHDDMQFDHLLWAYATYK